VFLFWTEVIAATNHVDGFKIKSQHNRIFICDGTIFHFGDDLEERIDAWEPQMSLCNSNNACTCRDEEAADDEEIARLMNAIDSIPLAHPHEPLLSCDTVKINLIPLLP
jgi:hypothetical protein